MVILGEFIKQIIIAIFFIVVIIIAVKLGAEKAKKKNMKNDKN